MKTLGHAMRALPVAGMMLAGLAGCGAGSGSQADRQAGQVSQGVAVGEPAPAALAMTGFHAMARDASCTENRNRLFIIDGKQVLWDHAGNCADAAYGQVLFGAMLETVLCTSGDTIAGPRASCLDAASLGMFETIVKNLDKADLGLGSAHKVERSDFLPKAGAAIPFERVTADNYSGVTQKKNVVIKDQAAWASLWAEHVAGRTPAPALPQVDFTSKMLVAVFLGHTGDCRTIAIPRVVAGTDSIKVEVDDRPLQTFAVCVAVMTQPMQVVAIDRTGIPVEFVPASGPVH
jgi:hypothetical protein